MKKIIFGLALFIAITTSITSCEKENSNNETNNNNANTCVGGVNAFLLPDSITVKFCQPNYSYFYLASSQRTLKLNNANVAIDTIINGGNFTIAYDSISPLPCAGQIMNTINLRCFTRLP